MLRLFCGLDHRESAGTNVFISSVLKRSSCPVSFIPLASNGLPEGTNTFTLSRFLVPWLCDFKGRAIFADGADMICRADIAELGEELQAMTGAVKVVKHKYQTRHPIKYKGTELESPNTNYRRKNWASLMLIDCEHDSWRTLTPDSLKANPMGAFLEFEFIRDEDIHDLDGAWNRMVDEGQPVDGAKILHWTAGIPAFEHYRDAPGADLWWDECRDMSYPLRIAGSIS
jgi:hypothetical protein